MGDDIIHRNRLSVRSRCGGTISVLAGAILAALLPKFLFYPPNVPTFDPSNVSRLSSGLVVVVTGANSGLGYDTVRHLLRKRADETYNVADHNGGPAVIVMACRDEIKCKNAKQSLLSEATINDSNIGVNRTIRTKILTLPLDLADPISIRNFARRLPLALNATAASASSVGAKITTYDVPIDVLINNAGVFTRDPSGVTYDNEQGGMDEHILVNHLGHVQLLHHLWKKLVRDKTRIVSVSSIAALLPIITTSHWSKAQNNEALFLGPFRLIWKHWVPSLVQRIADGMISYGRSKRANIVFANELHRRYHYSGISSVASHPGIASTQLWDTGAKIFPPRMAKFLKTNGWMSHSSYDGAATQTFAALDREMVPSGYYVGPRWWFRGDAALLGPLRRNDFHERESSMNWLHVPHFWPFARQEGARLWDQSLHALGIEEFGKVE